MSSKSFLLLSFIIVAFAISGMVLPTAFATQFIPYVGTTQPTNPKICIFDNIGGDDNKQVTDDAVSSWSTLLNHLTFSNNWNMHTVMVDKLGQASCNIVFIFTNERSDAIMVTGIDGKPMAAHILGVTQCDPNHGQTYCTITIFLLNVNKDDIFTTIQHEFGHALGIGHRQGDTAKDAMRAFLSDDLMYAEAKKFSHITNDDALAVINLYGVHGFHMTDIPNKPYIITHPTHILIYCNGISGKICVQHF